MNPKEVGASSNNSKCKKNNWTQRFLLASIIQGAIAVSLTIMLASFVISMPHAELLVANVLENPSIGYIEISALAGLGLYFLGGVLGTGLASMFYHYLDFHLGRNYGYLTNVLAWLHLLLTNIGISSASLTMIYAGYIGDLAIFPKEMGGFDMMPTEVSNSLLNHFIVPIGTMLLVAATGSICGGIGFIMAFIKR